jgi:hypothetical protein
MLNIQRFLRSQTNLDYIFAKLDEAGIKVNKHPTEPLYIFNYDMIEAKKDNKMACESRGLVLREGTWDIVAKAFTRFFNLHECPSLNFKWDEFSTQEKVDGSLILVYQHNGKIYVNTRNSWGDGFVNNSDKTWRGLVEEALDKSGLKLHDLFRNGSPQTYVFELCSPYNLIVTQYKTTQVYLLSAFNGEDEYTTAEADALALKLNLLRPRVWDFSSSEEVEEWLKKEGDIDPTFEGVVLRDRKGTRIKVKSARYVALHHLRGNGNVFLPKYMVPLCLNGEIDEAISYFDDLVPEANRVRALLDGEKQMLLSLWEEVKHIEDQKTFALKVVDSTKFSAIMFKARKLKVCPSTIWHESSDLIVKVLF